MKPLTRILAATDLSAPARHTAQRAALLARDIGARLELAHVLEQGALDELRRRFGADGESLRERIRSQAREALAQLAADIGRRAKALNEGTTKNCQTFARHH